MRKWSIMAALLSAGLSLGFDGEAPPTPAPPPAAVSPLARLVSPESTEAPNPAPGPTPAAGEEDGTGRIAFGLYNPGVPDDMGKVSATEDAIHQHGAILMWYKHWGGAWNNFYAQWVNAVAAHGAVPMITWMSDDYTVAGYPNPSVEAAHTNQRILNGAYDSFIAGCAEGLKATGPGVLLRLDLL